MTFSSTVAVAADTQGFHYYNPATGEAIPQATGAELLRSEKLSGLQVHGVDDDVSPSELSTGNNSPSSSTSSLPANFFLILGGAFVLLMLSQGRRSR